MKKRENGFYWVLEPHDGWIVSQYVNGEDTGGPYWLQPGWDQTVNEEYYDEVDENRISRDVHRT